MTATLHPDPYPGVWMMANNEGWDAYFARTDALLDAIIVKSSKIRIDDESLVGFLMRFPIADGYALYVVSRQKPLQLQHIPSGDGWRIPPTHLRGLRLTDVTGQIDMRDFWLGKETHHAQLIREG